MVKRFAGAVLALLLVGGSVALAQTKPTEEQYEADLAKRATGVLDALKLEDLAKADRVREMLITQYKSLRELHDGRDAKLKTVPKDDKAQTDAIKSDTSEKVKTLHEKFVAKLNSELTPEQVEVVKDKMTYNVVSVTYNGFCDMIPELTAEQKAYILAQLKEGRELAMDGGSSKEKHEIFGKYKGRINIYLSKQGYDLKKANKDWAERRKARESKATQPASS